MGEEKIVVPKDIVENLKKLATAKNIPFDTLKQRFKEIYMTHETVVALDNAEAKARVAWAILASQFVTRGRANRYQVYVISKSDPRKVIVKGEPAYVADVYTLAKNLEDENSKIEYAVLTLWRDAALKAKNLEPGKVYEAELIEFKQKWGLNLTSNETEFIEVNGEFPSIEEFYKKEIEPLGVKVTLAEADLNKSEFVTDIREIEATVLTSDVRVSATDNREFGIYTVIDDTYFDMMADGRVRGMTIWCNPDQVKWDTGSILKFIGTIDVDDNGEPRMFCHFILPTKLAIKKEIVKKEIEGGQEAIDINKLPEDAKEIEEKVKEESEEELIF